jgi:UDP-N-acetylmuramoylalanine--D-glutamate ligase
MIASRAFANRTVAVFGLARTGLGAVRSLVAGGTSVIAWDDSSTARDLGGQEGAELMPWREWPWEKIAALLLSPGVPLTHPQPHGVVEHANRAKVPVIGDVELFAREVRTQADQPGKAPVIAITGTNGKSTTTALVGHILNQCGFQRPDRRQYRQVGAGIVAAHRQDHLCAGNVQLPDRSYARSQARGLACSPTCRRSYRPSRHDGELRRHQGAAYETDPKTARW